MWNIRSNAHSIKSVNLKAKDSSEYEVDNEQRSKQGDHGSKGDAG